MTNSRISRRALGGVLFAAVLLSSSCGNFVEGQLAGIKFTADTKGDPDKPPTLAELAWLAGIWKRSDTFGDGWVVPAPERVREDFRQVYLRQVGSQGDPQIPYPTYCQYIYSVQEMPKIIRSPRDNSHYNIQYQVTGVSLTPNPQNASQGCAAFLQRQQAQAQAGTLNVSFDFYQDDEGKLVIVDDAATFGRQSSVESLLVP